MAVTTPGAFMRAEIAEQPDRWSEFIAGQRDALDGAARLLTASAPQLLLMAARGSSDHAAQFGQYLAHSLLGLPTMLSTPASITIDDARLTYPRSVMIAVSQSGASPDLLATVRHASAAAVPIIAITNSPSSPLAGLADVHIDLSSGPERSVAATKTYTTELLALLEIMTRTAQRPPIDISMLSRDGMAVLANAEREAESAACTLRNADRVLLVGRGLSMSSAKEAALKLMETSAMAASGWSSADATHGPLGQVVPGTPVIVFGAGTGRDSVADFAARASAMGGVVSAVLTPVPRAATTWSLTAVESSGPWTAPLLEILPMQRIALELSLLLGRNPDAPAGLQKVTLTN